MRYAGTMSLALDDLQASVGRATSNIREARIFTDKVLALSLEGFGDEDVDRLEALIEGAIHTLSKDSAEEARLLVITLTEAMKGVRHGLPPDPRRWPSRERLAEQFEDDLRSAAGR